MTTTRPTQRDRLKMNRLEWGVLFSLCASAASLIFSAGVIWTTVQGHDRAIMALQAKAATDTDRLARIETKIDVMMNTRPLPAKEVQP